MKSFLGNFYRHLATFYSSHCTGAKFFVWLDRILHHRADPANAVIGDDNSQTRSRLGATDQDMFAPGGSGTI